MAKNWNNDKVVIKSKESSLAAIQIFNSHLITFKSESFIVLMNIAWTHLLHAYYKKEKVEYREHKQGKKRKRYTKKDGNYIYYSLTGCLKLKECPLAPPVKGNLEYLIKVRNAIVHNGDSEIDNYLVGYFQACCINYNKALKEMFDIKVGLESQTTIALQFFSFEETQIDSIKHKDGLPKNMLDFIANSEFQDNSQYQYNINYSRRQSSKNKADKQYPAGATFTTNPDEMHDTVLVRTVRPEKFSEKQIVQKMKGLGFQEFNAYKHQQFWKKRWNNKKERDIKATDFGELSPAQAWYWYENWIDEVKRYCEEKNK